MSGTINPQFLQLLQILQQSPPSVVPPAIQPAQSPLAFPPQSPNWLAMPQPKEMPQAGYLPGALHLDGSIAPHVPDGAPRPFAPGEYLSNPDGSWSSEISTTVQHPLLNGGDATVLPSMWLVGGKPYRAKDDDEAVNLAVKSGLPFPSFGDIPGAENFANNREDSWQSMDAANPASAAWTVPPLWSFPQGTK